MIIRLAEGTLQTRFGSFNQILYYDGQKEIIALVMGDVAHKENVLCRVHSHCISAHIFNPEKVSQLRHDGLVIAGIQPLTSHTMKIFVFFVRFVVQFWLRAKAALRIPH